MTKNAKSKTKNKAKKSFKKYKEVIPYHPVPKSMLCKLRYINNFTINPAVGQSGSYIFSSNSIYDPDVTGVGLQPIGYDTYNSLYAHYVVLGSKCTATFVSQATVAGTSTAVVGIDLEQNTGVDAVNLINWQENPDSVWKYMSASNSSKSIVNVTKHYSTKSMFGVKNPSDGVGLGSDFGANPTKRGYFKVMMTPFNPGQDITTTNCRVVIEYIVLMQQRIDLPQS